MRKIYLKHDLENIETHDLPLGYRFRFYQSESDRHVWAEILQETKEYPTKQEALDRFSKEFLPYLSDVKERMIFLETLDGTVIGTATAWYGKFAGKEMGRLHWVEIIPTYQGRGLGRPLIVEAMKQLRLNHEAAYLSTQTRSKRGIHLYQDLGWHI